MWNLSYNYQNKQTRNTKTHVCRIYRRSPSNKHIDKSLLSWYISLIRSCAPHIDPSLKWIKEGVKVSWNCVIFVYFESQRWVATLFRKIACAICGNLAGKWSFPLQALILLVNKRKEDKFELSHSEPVHPSLQKQVKPISAALSKLHRPLFWHGFSMHLSEKVSVNDCPDWKSTSSTKLPGDIYISSSA